MEGSVTSLLPCWSPPLISLLSVCVLCVCECCGTLGEGRGERSNTGETIRAHVKLLAFKLREEGKKENYSYARGGVVKGKEERQSSFQR